MCSLAHQLLMACGPAPMFDYMVMGLGVGVAFLFITRPRV